MLTRDLERERLARARRFDRSLRTTLQTASRAVDIALFHLSVAERMRELDVGGIDRLEQPDRFLSRLEDQLRHASKSLDAMRLARETGELPQVKDIRRLLDQIP